MSATLGYEQQVELNENMSSCTHSRLAFCFDLRKYVDLNKPPETENLQYSYEDSTKVCSLSHNLMNASRLFCVKTVFPIAILVVIDFM